MLWMGPAQVLVDRLHADMVGWSSLTYSAEHGNLRLASTQVSIGTSH